MRAEKQLFRLGLLWFCYQIFPALLCETLYFHICCICGCVQAVYFGEQTLFLVPCSCHLWYEYINPWILCLNPYFSALASRLSEGQGDFVCVTCHPVVGTCPYSADVKSISLMLVSHCLRAKFTVCLWDSDVDTDANECNNIGKVRNVIAKRSMAGGLVLGGRVSVTSPFSLF